jgi:RNA-directed DNA polymerase
LTALPLDRLIQQAILQVFTPIFDPTFSVHSYGFRPNKRGHDAVRQAKRYIQEGYHFVVDMDLEKFFDRVNHDILMSRVARKIQDKWILKLIRSYLQAGIMSHGVCVRSEEGTPQGGPLSPLLANILLDDLDKELEKRGLRFCRYADDCNIYVKTQRAGEWVKASVTKYLVKKLKLKVNEEKSAVDQPWNRKFLGFSFTREENSRIRIAPKALKRVKDKIRSMIKTNDPAPMEQIIEDLNRYLMGCIGYYALIDTSSPLQKLDQWIRRRLRAVQWSRWKKVRTRYHFLRALGLKEKDVYRLANTRKGAWRISNTPQIHKILGNAYWQSLGLRSLLQRYKEIRQV